MLGYVGTIGMAHKIDFLIDCVKGLPEYKLMILGEGAEKETLQKKVKDEGVENVFFVDAVPKEKVGDYIALQDIALVNLRRDPLFTTVLPSKIFETAAMQIPILLGVDGEARRLVEGYNAGLFYEPEDKKDFLEKLDLLANNTSVYEACKAGGEKLAKDFDRKELAGKMLKVIEEAVTK